MGEFSQAFNSMVSKLEERELRLKEEIQVRQQAEAALREQHKQINDAFIMLLSFNNLSCLNWRF